MVRSTLSTLSVHHHSPAAATNRMRSWAVCLFATTLGVSSGFEHMRVEYGWRTMDFLFPNQSFKDELTNSGAYRFAASVPIDVDVARDGRVFVSMPKFFPGAVCALGTVSNQTQSDGSPLVEPYPDWSWHRPGDCDGIISVFRVKIDECNRLWVIDSGTFNYLTNRTQQCPPQLLVFNLTTNTLIARHRFPRNTLVNNYMLCTVEVETSPNSCGNAYAYVADNYGFGLQIFSLQANRSWRVSGNYFYPYPRSGRFLVAGTELYVMGGVIDLTLTPQGPDRRVYFQSSSSHSLSWVQSSVLRNESNFPNGTNLVPQEFHVSEGMKGSQGMPLVMDSNGILFLSYLSTNSVNCWNPRLPFNARNIVQADRDDRALEFVTSAKVIVRNGIEEVWTLACRYQRVTNLNNSELNFYASSGNIQQLVRGTTCQPNRR